MTVSDLPGLRPPAHLSLKTAFSPTSVASWGGCRKVPRTATLNATPARIRLCFPPILRIFPTEKLLRLRVPRGASSSRVGRRLAVPKPFPLGPPHGYHRKNRPFRDFLGVEFFKRPITRIKCETRRGDGESKFKPSRDLEFNQWLHASVRTSPSKTWGNRRRT